MTVTLAPHQLRPLTLYAPDMPSAFTDVIHDVSAQPFLPLLYAAWDDGDLTHDELAGLRELLCSGGTVRQSLLIWLDPHTPPSAEDLAQLSAHIQQVFSVRSGTRSPVELGATLSAEAGALLSQADALAGPFGPSLGLASSEASVTLAPLPDPDVAPFDSHELSRMIDGPHADTKQRVRTLLSQPEFRLPVRAIDGRVPKAGSRLGDHASESRSRGSRCTHGCRRQQ